MIRITRPFNRRPARHAVVLFLAFVLVAPDTLAQDLPDDLVDELRRTVTEALDQDSLGAGYAALVNFAVAPDISTARYSIDGDGGEEPELQVTRVPLRKMFATRDNGWTPFVQGNFSYQVFDAGFALGEGERIDAEWKSLGATISLGAEIPIGEHFRLLPVIDAGLVRLENSARYTGDLANLLLRPVLQGVLFDWDSDAWVLGASLSFDYDRPFERFGMKVHGSLTHQYVDSHGASSPFIGFSNHVTTLNVQAESKHPTGKSFFGYPLSLVAHLGSTHLFGGHRDALGFEQFLDGGLALEADVSEKGWRVQGLRLGAKLIAGKDVSGWGLILGFRY